MSQTRRQFLSAASALTLGTRMGLLCRADESQAAKALSMHAWVRDARNPIFLSRSSFDAKGAQGPCVVLDDGRWWMFYAGIGNDGVQRICLATADPDRPTEWERLGPILDLGKRDSFDEKSATYPQVYRIGGKWHLYYSGRSGRENEYHFSNYRGIGLAQSDDLRNWQKYSDEPVIEANGVAEYPGCQALVGLGNIIDIALPGGRTGYRIYYTLLPGLKDPNWKVNGTWHVTEHKVCVAAQSVDGISWTDRRVVFDRRRDVTSEDIGVVGLNVWRTGSVYRGVYTGLGTRVQTYSLCEATSSDGLVWDRGSNRDNVSLTPVAGQWDSAMIGYPCVLKEQDGIRIFYNGAGGGATGIGMASAPLLD